MTARRITVQWTETAKLGLQKLPPKVRRGLLTKADELAACDDPRKLGKPLVGPLEGFYRITYSRYRAIFSVHEERLADGEVLVHVIVCFVAAGIRKEGHKEDIYNLALKLVRWMKTTVDDRPISDSDKEDKT